jgi:hypothetical protein
VPACCEGSSYGLTYQISESSNTYAGIGMQYSQAIFSTGPLIGDTGTHKFAPVLSSVLADIQTKTFYVFAGNDIGIYAFSAQVTLNVICTPSSTTITEGTYADASLTDLQIVQTSNAGTQGTYFIHP